MYLDFFCSMISLCGPTNQINFTWTVLFMDCSPTAAALNKSWTNVTFLLLYNLKYKIALKPNCNIKTPKSSKRNQFQANMSIETKIYKLSSSSLWLISPHWVVLHVSPFIMFFFSLKTLLGTLVDFSKWSCATLLLMDPGLAPDIEQIWTSIR